MYHTLVASFSFALLVAIALLVREVRFRRSLQKLLHRLLARLWRPDSHAPPSSTHHTNPSDRRDGRL